MPKSAYWPKMCLLNENVHIEWKGAYQKVFIEML